MISTVAIDVKIAIKAGLKDTTYKNGSEATFLHHASAVIPCCSSLQVLCEGLHMQIFVYKQIHCLLFKIALIGIKSF